MSKRGDRRLALVANWKMNTDQAHHRTWLAGLNPAFKSNDLADLTVLVCPPSPYLTQWVRHAQTTPLTICAQDVSDQSEGAYTGQTSARMLSDIGVNYTLVGHSERRLYQGETDLQVAAKAFQALTCGLTPIVCLGETRAQRQAGHTETVVTAQLQTVLDRLVPAGFAGSFWLAYEPIWAIGTGLSATADQAQGVHATLRACLARYGVAHTPILYGGSVGPHNAQELFCQEDIDGGLVGSASLKTEDFLPILTALQSVISKRI